ncbi:hypothetical protein [Xylanimonas ulmi]|uniref:Uncharacterized protein n=1 Tax=Xylanimonas ulmi TaxID=228973 RepID=A0A4Q7M6L1_9MICO|nr:hypothetical protein [Xylanibacterium ulmi]RZS62248.1 hypothetical protein EV386_2573 [Xylanibacterium ulmi]
MSATPAPPQSPHPTDEARALLELAVGAQQVHTEAQTHLDQAVKAAVKAGATWEQVTRWLGDMTADHARERFEHTDAAVYLDEHTVILLGAFAARRGIRTLKEALTALLDEAPPATPAVDDTREPDAVDPDRTGDDEHDA